jgi:hypothetical protein
MKKVLVLCLTVGLVACSGSGGGGPKEVAVVSGTVWLKAVGEQVGDKVKIEAWLDADGNGKIAESEKTTAQTDDAGAFSFQVPAGSQPTVLVFSRRDYATQYQTVKLQPDSHIEFQVVLFESREAFCQGGVCTDSGSAISVTLPEADRGRLRVFNPLVDALAFPGEFRDSEGKMLISSVFASVEIFDQDGNQIKALPAGRQARLEMRVPRDTWNTIYDLQPGDDRIQVPMYYFDEVSGQWKRDGTGWLAAVNGEALAEAQLPRLLDGTLSGDIYAVAEVSHFSYWNVDWPEPDNTSLSFQVVDEQDRPVLGAFCMVIGDNFAGNSRPLASGTGSECIDLWRSEKTGEDLNGNGIAGEERRAYVICVWNGKYYRFPPFTIPQQAASCPQAGMDLQKLRLDKDSEVPVELCTVRGRVLLNGVPVLQAMVSVEDPAVPDDAARALCGSAGCRSTALSGADGSFEVTNAMASGLGLTSFTTRNENSLIMIFKAEKRFGRCPQEPVDVHLSLDQCQTDQPQISANKSTNSISWQPVIKAGSLLAAGHSGEVKWLVTSENGFLPPVTYGQVPSGAMQFKPESGQPATLASGDVITVIPLGGYVSVGGYRCLSYGHLILP